MVCRTFAVATNRHLRQIVFHVEVVVLEGAVLFGVQNFQQGGCGIAAEVGSHFVDFVEHEDGIFGAGLLHGLQDLSWHGADVGAAMTANFRLIANAAERHANELATGGFGN